LTETRWVRGLAFAGGAAVAAWGGVGLVLADRGWYRPWLALPIGLAAWLVLLWLGRSALRAPGRSDASAQVGAAGACVLSVSVGIWNALHASQHVLTDRDPAVYNNAGRWIAAHGTLLASTRQGPFATGPFDVSAPGLYPVPNQRPLVFQFAHLLPALLAEARAIGGDRLMFRAVPLLGTIALLAFYVVASRVLRAPLAALAATACLAFTMPQVFFSRDSYSEIPSQVLFFTALWLFADERMLRRAQVAFCAGLFLGLLQASRIDALAVIAGAPLIAAVAWIRAEPGADRRRVALGLGAAWAGGVIGALIGVVDLATRSRPYVHDLRGSVLQLIALTALTVSAAVAIVLLHPLLRRISLPDRRRLRMLVANAGAAVIVLAGVVGWFVRPALQPINFVLTSADGSTPIVPDGQQHVFFARSVAWLGWYFGPLTLVLAIAGAALVIRQLVLNFRWHWFAPTALLVFAALLYLWRPSASPDHVWVSRRLLVATFPATVLAAFGVIVAIFSASKRVQRRPLRVSGQAAAVLCAVVAVAYPIGTLIAVRSMSEERGFLAAVKSTCTIVGRNAAVVVVPEADNVVHLTFPQPTRGWCGIPAAQYRGAVNAPALVQAAAEWKARGRVLWVAAQHPETLTQWFPGVQPRFATAVSSRDRLSAPLTHRPRGYVSQSFSIALAPVPTS
jgi:hypothetical protein